MFFFSLRRADVHMNLLDIFEIAYSAFTRINLTSVHTKLTSESSHRNRIVLKPRLQCGF